MAVLELGGNAFDAAVAAGLTLQVVEPHLNGPGGDLPALIWPAHRDRPVVLCAQGPAPAAATIARYRDELGLSLDSRHRPAVGRRPRRVRRLARAAARVRDAAASRTSRSSRSTMPRRAIPSCPRSPARFATSRGSSATSGRRRRSSTFPSPSPGRWRRNSQLAETYRRLAGSKDPVEDWYRGWVAEELVAFQERAWRDSSRRAARGAALGGRPRRLGAAVRAAALGRLPRLEVFKAGPWSQAPVFLQQLRLLEGFDLAAMGQNRRSTSTR